MKSNIISSPLLLALLLAQGQGCGAAKDDKGVSSKTDAETSTEEQGTSTEPPLADLSGAVAFGISGAGGGSALMLGSGSGETPISVEGAGIKKVLDNGDIKGIFGFEWTVPVRKIVSTADRMLIQVSQSAKVDTGKKVFSEMLRKEVPIINSFECQFLEIKKGDSATSCALEGLLVDTDVPSQGTKLKLASGSQFSNIGEMLGVLGTGEIVSIGSSQVSVQGEIIFPSITETRIDDEVKPVVTGKYVLVSGSDSKGPWVKAIDSSKKPTKIASVQADWMLAVDGVGYFQTTDTEANEIKVLKFDNGTVTEESTRPIQAPAALGLTLVDSGTQGLGAYKMGDRVIVLDSNMKLTQTLPVVLDLAPTSQKSLVKALAFGETLVIAGEQLVQYDPETQTEKVLVDGYDIWDFAIVGDVAYLSASQGPTFMTLMVNLLDGTKTEAPAQEQLTQLQAF